MFAGIDNRLCHQQCYAPHETLYTKNQIKWITAIRERDSGVATFRRACWRKNNRLFAGDVELTIPIAPQLRQQDGFLHGGVSSCAADTALTFVGGSVLGPAVVTSEYKINYLRPAIGKELIAKAKVVCSSKTQAVCRCDLFVVNEGSEKLCAISQGTIARIAKILQHSDTHIAH